MKERRMLSVFGSIDDRYVKEYIDALGSQPQGTAKPSIRKPLLVAALVALMLLLLGCAVDYVLGMQDLKIGQRETTAVVFDAYHREIVGERPLSQYVLTLSDFGGTPGFQAAQEWLAFMQSYDPDRTVFEAECQKYESPVSRFPKEYQVYLLYTQEMVEKLDEIKEKYGLKLMGEELNFQSTKDQLRTFGIDHVTMPDSLCTVLLEKGRGFSGGNFRVSVELTAPEDADMWPYTVYLDFRYSRKDCLSTDFQYLDTSKDWREWNYVTASGETVLILRADGESWAYLICDCGDAVISVIFEPGYHPLTDDPDFEATWMTDRQVERVADAIDFSVRPSLPNAEAAVPVGHAEGWEIVPKSAVFDGSMGRIVFSMTAPEGTELYGVGDGVPLPVGNVDWVIPDNAWSMLSPKTGEFAVSPATCYSEDDGDGKKNTADLVFIFRALQIDDPAFPLDAPWVVRIEDLRMSRFDGFHTLETIVAEGIWESEITFETAPALELLKEPITAVDSWSKTPIVITSMQLRSLGLTLTCRRTNSNPFIDDCTVVMKDGSEVMLGQDSTDFREDNTVEVRLLSESVIDLEQAAVLRLSDGTEVAIR